MGVVVDVLRATSTVATALTAGYDRVLCCDSIERAEGLRGPGRTLAGEKECVKVPGFDKGNSPAEFERSDADEVVLATTNGCPAIIAATERSSEVVLASLLNLDAILARIGEAEGDVVVVCAGTNGGIAFEDVYVAGRIGARLEGERTDAMRVAEGLARAYTRAEEALGEGSNAAVLRESGLEDDIAYCARESTLDVIPRVASVEPGIAVVDAGGGEPRGAPADSQKALKEEQPA